jgi:hypothetical protein
MRLFAVLLGLLLGFAVNLVGVPIYSALISGLVGLILCLIFGKDPALFAVAGIGLGTFIPFLAIAAFTMNSGLLLLGACFGLIVAALNGLGAAAGVGLAIVIRRLIGRE